MATPQQQQLTRICGNPETLSKAKELLNIARAKTGPGSGHKLGSSASALPAICAFLASERLGNNDVTEKIAQQASCIHPKAFQTALNTTRAALAKSLSAQKTRIVSYQSLARTYGLDSDAMYWIEEVDKQLRTNDEELKDLEAAEESILYCVFYWTCIALHIRAVKEHTIVSEYGVNLREFQELQRLLDSTCRDLHESIDKHISTNRTTRSSGASPVKHPRKVPETPIEQASSSKMQSSPPTDDSPLKRKNSLPALPFVSPSKKLRTASPIKLNRIPVGSSMTNVISGPTTRTPSPAKRNRNVVAEDAQSTGTTPSTPTRPTGILQKSLKGSSPLKEDEVIMPERVLSPTKLTGTPVKAIGDRLDRLLLKDKTSSPSKSPRKGRASPDPSTPTRNRGRALRRLTHATTNRGSVGVDRTEGAVGEDVSSSEEAEKKSPCRHRIHAFPDRSFYLYTDPRATREWELCDKNMKAMIKKFGHPFEVRDQTILAS